jgi:hypothetical protein
VKENKLYFKHVEVFIHMKNIIRKIASVGAGFTMLGATVGGAFAADLSDLDTGAPFVSGGDYVNAAIVVGAQSNDVTARDTLRDHFDGFVSLMFDGENLGYLNSGGEPGFWVFWLSVTHWPIKLILTGEKSLFPWGKH